MGSPRRFTFVDLFAGCGGMALGFRRAGFRSVWAVEQDPDAAATYRANFHHRVHAGPIEDVVEVPRQAAQADVVIGGPPCQGFSPLGRFKVRPEHAQMNDLWLEFMRIVRMIGPRAVLIENVPQFLESEQGRAAVGALERTGFSVVSTVLDAYDYGVPQHRRRAFLLASRVGPVDVPRPPKRPRVRTVRRAFAGLTEEPTGVDWHVGRHPTDLSLERYAVIPAGGNRFDLLKRLPDKTPVCWRKKTDGSTDVFGRLVLDQPSGTIRTEFFKPEKGRYLHPTAHRPITHREAMRLQSFPDGTGRGKFVWHGSNVSVARQVGNAVPPRLAYYLAREFRKTLEAAKAADVAEREVRSG